MKKHLFEFETSEGIAAEGGGAKPAEEGRPEWLAEKFAKPEDLAKSYEEAEKEMGRLRSEMEAQGRQFSEALQEMTAESQRQKPAYDPSADPDVTAFREGFEGMNADQVLGSMLKIQQRLLAADREQQTQQMQPQQEALIAQQQDLIIRTAEDNVKQELITAGLDYEASRQEVIDQIKEFGGLPQNGTIAAHEAMIRAAGQVVHARAIADAHQKGEFLRREKLAAGTVQPGAQGRLATGSQVENEEWDKIKNAQDVSYAGLMGRAARQ